MRHPPNSCGITMIVRVTYLEDFDAYIPIVKRKEFEIDMIIHAYPICFNQSQTDG